ncbi:amylase [Corynebacterium diphtheriae]|nr:amylase [Corynebacterium diphtheriae]
MLSMDTRDPHAWWRDAAIYQIYPKSFASSGGPMGTLRGITSRLDYVRDLGVDAIWLSPFYTSPQRDGGYDVADYFSVDPLFGSNADAEELISEAHDRGLRVIFDLVPNHTSDQHVWFREALQAGPGSPERNHYWFREGKGPQDCEPPNDWLSIFGGSAWTQVCARDDAPGSPWEYDTSWYLHLFDSSQPDLNWSNNDVVEFFDSILRFWLDRGVDGFRVDVAHGLAKDPELPDWQFHWTMVDGGHDSPEDVPPPPMWNREEVHQIYRHWRTVLDEYPGNRALVAEAWVDATTDIAHYVQPDEMNQAFNFDFLICPWRSEDLGRVIHTSLEALAPTGSPATWVMSNHDVVRASSRLGLSTPGARPNGIRATDEQPDADLGARRARAAHMLMYSLPGSVYIYQGEELNLPEHTMLDDALRQDPTYFRPEHREAGRDGCRIPLPWTSQRPGLGFSPTGQTWLPQPEGWENRAVSHQESDPHSDLMLFRRMLQVRKSLNFGRGRLSPVWLKQDCLAYINSDDGRCDVMLIVAFDQDVAVPEGWHIALSTEECHDVVAANSAAWLLREGDSWHV